MACAVSKKKWYPDVKKGEAKLLNDLMVGNLCEAKKKRNTSNAV